MSIEKRLNKAAMIKGAAWGTAAQCGAAGCGLTPSNPGAFKLQQQMLEVDDIQDANETGLDLGNINPSDFSLDFNGFQWDGNEAKLLALLMGTAGVPAGAGSAKTHTLAMKDEVNGLFLTYAVEKGAKIHVVPSAKVLKAAFGVNGGLIKATFGLRGQTVEDDNAVVTSLASVTYPSIHKRARFNQTVFRVNAQSGAGLASPTDVVEPRNFTLDIERKMDSEHVSGSKLIIEPRENAKTTVKLSMEFPRIATVNEAYFANWKAGAEKKADIVITGPLIAGSDYYTLKFEFPRLIIEDVDYPDGAIIPAKVTFRAVVADAAPTGMTGLTKPVTVTLINTGTADLLA